MDSQDLTYVWKKCNKLWTFHYFSAANQYFYKILVATCSSHHCRSKMTVMLWGSRARKLFFSSWNYIGAKFHGLWRPIFSLLDEPAQLRQSVCSQATTDYWYRTTTGSDDEDERFTAHWTLPAGSILLCGRRSLYLVRGQPIFEPYSKFPEFLIISMCIYFNSCFEGLPVPLGLWNNVWGLPSILQEQ